MLSYLTLRLTDSVGTIGGALAGEAKEHEFLILITIVNAPRIGEPRELQYSLIDLKVDL